MTLTLAFLLAGLFATTAHAEIDPLAHWRWERRVLVVAAPAQDDPAFQTQERVLAADPGGLLERDLVIVEIVGAAVWTSSGSPPEAGALQKRLDLPDDRFAVCLVGKDGGIKLTENGPVSLEQLFGLIDAMPMRKGEMGK